jgi:hypothetical protein
MTSAINVTPTSSLVKLLSQESLPLTDASSCSTTDDSDDGEKTKTILSGKAKSSKLPENMLALVQENTELKRLLHSLKKERVLLQKQLMEKSTPAVGTTQEPALALFLLPFVPPISIPGSPLLPFFDHSDRKIYE